MSELDNNNENKKGKFRSFIDSLLEGCIGVGCIFPMFSLLSITGIIIWII